MRALLCLLLMVGGTFLATATADSGPAARKRPEVICVEDFTHGRTVWFAHGYRPPALRDGSRVVFDSVSDPVFDEGNTPILPSKSQLNVAYDDPNAYECGAACGPISDSAKLFPMSPSSCTEADHRAPQAGGANFTDVIWDEYTAIHALWPNPGGTAQLIGIDFVPYAKNTSGVDRQNRLFFWIIGDPNDDPNGQFAPVYLSGAVTLGVPAGMDGYWHVPLNLIAAGITFDVPEHGFLVLDWENTNRPPLGGTACGMGYMVAGGDLASASVPTPQERVRLGSIQPDNWWAWSAAATDPNWDGVPGLSISDIVNTPHSGGGTNPNWAFPSLAGGEYGHGVPFKLIVTCAACLNDPSGTDCDTDIDCNCRIDNVELQAVLNSWARSVGHPDFDPRVDYNGNDTIDNSDLQAILEDWANDCS